MISTERIHSEQAAVGIKTSFRQPTLQEGKPFMVIDYVTGKKEMMARNNYLEEVAQLVHSTKHAANLLDSGDLSDEEKDLTEHEYKHEMNRLASMHEGLVGYIAFRLPTKFSEVLDKEDLLQEGRFGFTQALRKYKERAKLSTYAGNRIWGAMMDAIRTEAESKGLKLGRKMANKIEKIRKLTPDLDGPARVAIADDIAATMEITREEVIELIVASETVVVSLESEKVVKNDNEEVTITDTIISGDLGPEEILMRSTEIGYLNEIICRLPERQAKLLVMYYSEGKTMKELGTIFKISESRVSQLHTESILILRRYLELAKEEGIY